MATSAGRWQGLTQRLLSALTTFLLLVPAMGAVAATKVWQEQEIGRISVGYDVKGQQYVFRMFDLMAVGPDLKPSPPAVLQCTNQTLGKVVEYLIPALKAIKHPALSQMESAQRVQARAARDKQVDDVVNEATRRFDAYLSQQGDCMKETTKDVVLMKASKREVSTPNAPRNAQRAFVGVLCRFAGPTHASLPVSVG